MNIFSPCNISLFMAGVFFLLGLGTFIIGIVVLVNRALGRDMRALAVQTTRLAQKGIADDIAGLVGNANNLLGTLNEMVRTAAGIGVFLAILGLLIMASTFWLVYLTRTLCLT